MRSLRISRTTWAVGVFAVSAGPAVVFMPGRIRLVVALVAVAGWALGYLLVRFLASGLLTDLGWRRPSGLFAARREYVIPVEVPPPPGPLIGRDEEVRLILDHLARAGADGPRVVVLSGPTGVGKSALAIGVAQALADRYQDGQLLARLDRAASGEAGVDEVLRTFVGALQDPHDAAPAGMAERVRRYRELTVSRRVLVILEFVDDLDRVRPLLPAGRGCAAILTSRGRLPLDESWLEVPVRPLDRESALRVLDALVGHGRVEAEPDEARRIVEAADRHPYALQVAAAALASRRNWTLKVAVARMREVPPAPPSDPSDPPLPPYAAALDLSYALLTQQERRGLLLLGLADEPAVAPWMLGALMRGAAGDAPAASDTAREAREDAAADGVIADGVAGHGVAGDDAGRAERSEAADAVAARVLDRLVYARLVDRRLDDVTGVATFRVVEEVRSYLRARLTAEVSPEARERAVAELAEARRRRGARSSERVVRGEVYRLLGAGELSAALNTARAFLKQCQDRAAAARAGGQSEELTRTRVEEGLALAALAEVNGELGWLEDARLYAEAALDTHTDQARPRALRCLGATHASAGRLDEALRCLNEAASAARRLGEPGEIVRTLRVLAVIEARQGRYDQARATVREAIDRCDPRRDDGRRRLPGVLWAQGFVLLAAGEPDEADRVLARAEEVCAEPGQRQALWLAWIRHRRALVALQRCSFGPSRAYALRASSGFRDMNHRYGIAHCRLLIGRVHLAEGNHQAAVTALEEAVQTFSGCGDRWIEAECRCWLGEAQLAAGRWDPDRWESGRPVSGRWGPGHPDADRLAAAAEAFARAAQDFHDLGDFAARARARAGARRVAAEARRREAIQEGREPREPRIAVPLADAWAADVHARAE